MGRLPAKAADASLNPKQPAQHKVPIECAEGWTPMKIDGGCHCGKIRCEAEVDPSKVVICHCTDCQTLSGSPTRTVVPNHEGSFRLLSGTAKLQCQRAGLFSADGAGSQALSAARPMGAQLPARA
jgi:hypothetical protein